MSIVTQKPSNFFILEISITSDSNHLAECFSVSLKELLISFFRSIFNIEMGLQFCVDF